MNGCPSADFLRAVARRNHVALSPVGSGHITADKRFGSCRASTQITIGSDNMLISGFAFGCAQIPGRNFRYELDRCTKFSCH